MIYLVNYKQERKNKAEKRGVKATVSRQKIEHISLLMICKFSEYVVDQVVVVSLKLSMENNC